MRGASPIRGAPGPMTPGNPRRGNGWFDMGFFGDQRLPLVQKKANGAEKTRKTNHDSCLKKIDFYGSCDQETEDVESQIP